MRRSFSSAGINLTKRREPHPSTWSGEIREMSLKILKERARRLTLKATNAECALAIALDNEEITYEFQHIINPFIIDFYFPEVHLCVELDGASHLDKARQTRDYFRTRYLYKKGYIVIRFWNSEVIADPISVVNVIKGYLDGATN